MTYDKLLSAAIRAAVSAGIAVLDIYHTDFSVETKADNSPLTRADRISHGLIEKDLAEYNIPILSEEGRQIPYTIRKHWGLLWLVDPLDGTKEFVKRNGAFTINIALIEKNTPVIGVIYVPVSGVLFYAAKDVGAYRLDRAISIIDATAQSDFVLSGVLGESVPLPVSPDQNAVLTIVGSRSHGSAEFDRFTEFMRSRQGEITLMPAGSSVKFCLTAEGSADLYPRFGATMEWDTAAGQAIVENAGMRVLDVKTGENIYYNKESLLNPWFIAGKKAALSLIHEVEFSLAK